MPPSPFRFRWARAVLAFIAVGSLAFPVLYFVAITASPNRTSDGHPTMPIGQVAFAMFASPVVAAVAGFFFGRRK